ncbi:hypothetical protein BJX64DRAFT_285785 [Aspergillus heterothallicus]
MSHSDPECPHHLLNRTGLVKFDGAPNLACHTRVSRPLPNDILFEILLILRQDQDAWVQAGMPLTSLETSTPTIPDFHAVLLVSRQFYLVARLFLYQTIYLFRDTQALRLVRTINESPAYSEYVKNLLFIEPLEWMEPHPDNTTGASSSSRPLPQLWNSVLKQRPTVAAVWEGGFPRDVDVALALAFLLLRLKSLTSFKYHAYITPLEKSVKQRGSALDWIFNTLIHTLGSRTMGRGLMHSLQHAHITGLSPPNKASFLRLFLKLPNLHSLSIEPASQLDNHYLTYPHALSTTLRALHLTTPLSLTNLPGITRAIHSLETLYLTICPTSVSSRPARTSFTSALQPHHTTLKHLHILPATACTWHRSALKAGPSNSTPWTFWAYDALRNLTVPVELYAHYDRYVANAADALIPPGVESFTLATWAFADVCADMLEVLALQSAQARNPGLKKVVLKDLGGWACGGDGQV